MKRCFVSMTICMALLATGVAYGEVLVYTDNSPGAIITANAMHHAARSQGYATIVTLDEAEFIALLPQRQWDSVLVVTRYESATPGYRDALAQYVDAGGWAQIFTWKDDPNRTIQGPLLLGPTAIQVWTRGKTARTYTLCQTTRIVEPAVNGYVLEDFTEVTGGTMQAVVEPTCVALVAGAYQSVSVLPENLTQALAEFYEELDSAWHELEMHMQLCHDVYGGDPHAQPPIEGDPDGLATCVQEASDHYKNRVKKAQWRFKHLKKKHAAKTPVE